MQVIEIYEDERDYWDEAIGRFEIAHPFNAFGWGKVRAADGWLPTYLLAKEGNAVTGGVMVLTKYLPGRRLSVMYAPRGPVMDPSDQQTLEALLKRVKLEAKKRHTIFLRIDPNFSESCVFQNGDWFKKEKFRHLTHRWSFWNAPCDSYRVNLTRGKNEEEIFKILDPKARNGVRRAKNEGITVSVAQSLEEVAAFYKIFSDFAAHRGFLVRGYHYLESLWKEFISKGKGRLFVANYQGKIIGGEICLVFGRFCAEMHRGIPYEYHKLRVNEALVWEGIRWAMESRCLWYSLRGSGPTPAHDKFKEKFGELVSLVGYYDFPFHSTLYRLFCTSEFELLPRSWKTLMKARKLYYDFANRLKGKGSE